jgi:hypothetical protein
MIRKKGRAKSPARDRDHDKEVLFKVLAGVLERAGYTVRREELKRGPSWSVHSGVCRALDQRLIFVDRRITQDDQVALLSSYLTRLSLTIEPEEAARLSPKCREKVEALVRTGEPDQPVVEAA